MGFFDILQCTYLGGFPEYATSRRLELKVEDSGVVAYSIFFRKRLFSIPWDVIREVRQRTESHEEQTSFGGIMEGAALIGAGSKAGRYSSAPTTLAIAGASSRKNVREHFLEIEYEVHGVRGFAAFQFRPGLIFNKQPAAKAVSLINAKRISLRQPVLKAS